MCLKYIHKILCLATFELTLPASVGDCKLVTSVNWSHQSTGHISQLVTSVNWLHQSTGYISQLVTSVNWLHQSTGYTSQLVTSVNWLHQSTGYISQLVTSVNWLHQSTDYISQLVTSVNWLHRSPEAPYYISWILAEICSYLIDSLHQSAINRNPLLLYRITLLHYPLSAEEDCCHMSSNRPATRVTPGGAWRHHGNSSTTCFFSSATKGTAPGRWWALRFASLKRAKANISVIIIVVSVTQERKERFHLTHFIDGYTVSDTVNNNSNSERKPASATAWATLSD